MLHISCGAGRLREPRGGGCLLAAAREPRRECAARARVEGAHTAAARRDRRHQPALRRRHRSRPRVPRAPPPVRACRRARRHPGRVAAATEAPSTESGTTAQAIVRARAVMRRRSSTRRDEACGLGSRIIAGAAASTRPRARRARDARAATRSGRARCLATRVQLRHACAGSSRRGGRWTRPAPQTIPHAA